ncbi:MAG: subclass B3 metallo-beta-lactamase [Rudaea sp.]
MHTKRHEQFRSTPDPAEWTTPIEPFRIAGNIYYVGTEGLSAYLIVSDRGAILLDGTLQQNAALIERNIESVGVALKDVKIVISDHAHTDHVGAIAKIKADTGAEFIASAGDRWALEHGEPRGDTTYAPMTFPPIHVDAIIGDGETKHLGNVVLTAHLTPGHTPGCTTWSMSVQDGDTSLRVVFLCSITVAGNVLVGNKAYPGIVADYRATFDRLQAMPADIVLTSHPDMSDVLGRRARRDAGDVNAFVDPTELPRIVSTARAEFEKSLAAASKPKH